MADYLELYDSAGTAFVVAAATCLRGTLLDTSLSGQWYDYLRAYEKQAREYCYDEGQGYVPPISIRFGLLDQSSFRAVATKHFSYGYVILISLGALQAINHLCGLIVSKGFFREVGNAPEIEKYEPSEEASRSLLLDLQRNTHFSLTPDVSRQTLGIIFEQTMFRYILFHEIAHTVDGHLDMAQDQMRLEVILDQQSVDIPSDGSLTGHALEVIADSIAVRMTLSAAFSDHENRPDISPEVTTALNYFHKSPRETLFHTLISIYMLYELMDNPTRNQRPLPSGTHPPAPFRFKCTLAVVSDWIAKSKISFDVDIDDLFHSVIDTGHALIGISYQRRPNRAWLNSANSPEADQHFANIHKECERLEPILTNCINTRRN